MSLSAFELMMREPGIQNLVDALKRSGKASPRPAGIEPVGLVIDEFQRVVDSAASARKLNFARPSSNTRVG